MGGTEIAIVGLIISAGAAVYQGVQAKGQAEIMEAGYREQQDIAKLQAIQEANDRRERLRMILASQAAVAASSGIQLDASRSFLAAKKAEIESADRDVRNIQLFGASQQRQFGIAAKGASASGKASLYGGFLSAGGSLLSGGVDIYKTRTPSNNIYSGGGPEPQQLRGV
jgi:hypothetical protein